MENKVQHLVLVYPVRTPDDWEQAFSIRKQVFVDEQKVPLELERDEIDEIAYHVLGTLGGKIVATGRAFADPKDSSWARIGRMAVLPIARGKGVASEVLKHLLNFCKTRGFKKIMLHSQSYVTSLYKSFGFAVVGDPFEDAGIRHVEMILEIPNKLT
ncbi:GNAT family N-acetyltransferase [bacterium]|nr:GNAT family N-acetyltransferase [bacterium]